MTAQVTPEEVGQRDQQQRGDDPALGELVGGDPHRLGQQAELEPAERVQQRAAVVGQHVAGDVGEHAEGNAHGQHRDVPGRHLLQVPALPQDQGGQPQAEQVGVVAADVQGAEARREQQGEQEPGRDQVPPQLRVPGGDVGAVLPLAGAVGGQGHDGHAEQAVRALPVAAADRVHDPGEGPGQEAEGAGDGGPGLVQVGEDPGARGQRGRHGEVGAGHRQQGGDGGEGQGAGQRVVVAEHAGLPGVRWPGVGWPVSNYAAAPTFPGSRAALSRRPARSPGIPRTQPLFLSIDLLRT